ncbi:hypothetical protein PAXINDRAFT_100817 [Paxillus involutus ATCC 200175]|uniref:Uncharacterized protein n=1 Tax=Paxillus involutus ATCC 200175 TaxID=664439 RepID=A0A0C9U1A3_PAXIN|nr:hypothetical protein PAXINDRAFT_100817 [Paxillus involutus ATCC 200175]
MDYPNWLKSQQEVADLSSVSWLLNPPSGFTAPQSDTFANVAFSLQTPPGSCQTLMPPRSHDGQSTYEGMLPETNSSANASSGTTLLDHPPQNFARQRGHNSGSGDDRSTSLRAGPEVCYPVRIQEGNPASHARLSASVPLSEPYTTEDVPNPGKAVLRDDLNFVALRPDETDSDHVCRVSFVLWVLLSGMSWHECGSLCPKVSDLWLQMIEGTDDVDEVWLWVDGDEEWIQQSGISGSYWSKFRVKLKEDWAAAQSALRRRMARSQVTACHVPKKTAYLTLEDHARLQEATLAQRCAAIDWLIRTSRRKEDSDFQLGLSSRSKFGLGNLIDWWFQDTSNLRLIAQFPEQPEAYKEFVEKRKAMGCKCLDQDWEKVSEWVRMMRWLRPEWNLDVACIYLYDCDACKIRAKGLWNRLYGNDHSRDTLLLPIQLAFSLVFVNKHWEYMDLKTSTSFAKAVAAKSLGPNAQREADECFWPLCSPGERDIKCPPWVNAYPEVMRDALVRISCEVGPHSGLHSLTPSGTLEREYLEQLPVGFADNAPNLVGLVGAVIWMVACRFVGGPWNWHDVWTNTVSTLLKFKSIVLPELVGTQLELRTHFQRLCTKHSPCFGDHNSDDAFWKIYSNIVVYVKSLNLGPKFKGCSICHAFYITATVELGFAVETSRTSRPGEPVPTENLLSSSLHTEGSSVIRHHRQEASSALASRPLRSQNLGSAKSADAEMDFWSLLRDTSLAPAERQQTFDAGIRKLVTLASSIGLRLPGDLIPAAVQRRPDLPASSFVDIVDIGANDGQETSTEPTEPRELLRFTEIIQEQHISAPSTQPGDVTTVIFNPAPNVDLKKRHKIARIKEILIEMLRAIDFPLHNRYLPWSMLEGDLQKHGYEITHWPSGVPRENDKGISTLSAGQVNKLYLALTQATDLDRPRFIRRVDQSTDQDKGMTPVPNGPGSKRRLEIVHNDGNGKRTRFKVITAEYYAGQSTDG